MWMWWPRILPFIGLTWVHCDRYGARKPVTTVWEVQVFIVGWGQWALVVWQSPKPQRVDKR